MPVSRCAAGALGRTLAKRATEIGAPSLKHPFARVFTALRPFAAGELKGVQCGVFPLATENLGGKRLDEE